MEISYSSSYQHRLYSKTQIYGMNTQLPGTANYAPECGGLATRTHSFGAERRITITSWLCDGFSLNSHSPDNLQQSSQNLEECVYRVTTTKGFGSVGKTSFRLCETKTLIEAERFGTMGPHSKKSKLVAIASNWITIKAEFCRPIKRNMTSSNKVTKRSANYTNREIHVIMDEYIRRKNILENNTNPLQNLEQKRRAWVEIAEHVNVISPTKRTYTDVRKKVSDMKTSAKRKMLRYLKESLAEGSKSPLIKPQIDERLLEILQENGVIPPYKCILKRGMSCPEDVQKPLSEEEGNNKEVDVEEPLSSGSASIPVSVAEVSCSPSITVDSVATHTPSSGYDTQPDPNRMKHLRESVDRLTSSVDRLGDSLVKISRSLEKIVESNQQMFSVINSNVVRILESQNNIQSSCLPPVNNQQR